MAIWFKPSQRPSRKQRHHPPRIQTAQKHSNHQSCEQGQVETRMIRFLLQGPSQHKRHTIHPHTHQHPEKRHHLIPVQRQPCGLTGFGQHLRRRKPDADDHRHR